jgi:hypothetical protein
MAEIFEIEEIPQAVATMASESGSGKEKAGGGGSGGPSTNDKHIPSFDFNGYPTVT